MALPLPTRTQTVNKMAIAARLLWIVLIGVAGLLATGMYLAGVESLSRLLAS
jgi:hypothetical protein